jgi:hypothetical protein
VTVRTETGNYSNRYWPAFIIQTLSHAASEELTLSKHPVIIEIHSP